MAAGQIPELYLQCGSEADAKQKFNSSFLSFRVYTSSLKFQVNHQQMDEYIITMW